MARRGMMLMAAAGLALVAGPGAAQINPYKQAANAGPDDIDNDDVMAPTAVPGLVGYNRGLQLGANVSTRYEDNISRQPIKDDGIRVRPGVRGSYGLGLGRGGLFVQGNYGRDFIYGTSRLPSSDRLMLGGGVDFQLSRCTGQAGGSWRRGLTFASDTALFGGFSQEMATAGFAAQCRLGSALSINGSVLRSDIKSVRSGANLPFSSAFDMQRWSYSAGLGFGTAALGQFSLSGSVSDSTMPGRVVLAPTGVIEDGLKNRSARFGYSKRLGTRINVSAGVSYIDTQPNSTVQILLIDGIPQLVERPGFRGLGYDASLDLALTPRMGFTVTAGRNTNATGAVGAQFTIADTWAATMNYQLGRRYTIAAGITQRHNQYRGAFISPLEPARRVADDFTRLFAQFGGRLGERIRFSVDVTHAQRRSNPAVLNFNSTGVGLTLGYQLGRG